MTLIRTSHTHPLKIAEVRANENFGFIGITFCPGKYDRYAVTGIWERDLCVFRFVRPPVPVSSGQAFRCDPASMI